MSPEKREELADAVRDRAEGGRIPCSVLRKTAEELEVPYTEAGSVADELDVRIVQCDLGCF